MCIVERISEGVGLYSKNVHYCRDVVTSLLLHEKKSTAVLSSKSVKVAFKQETNRLVDYGVFKENCVHVGNVSRMFFEFSFLKKNWYVRKVKLCQT